MTKALPLLGSETFLLVNGDVWTDLDFSTIPSSLSGNDQAMLFLVDQPDWREKGDFNLEDSRVRESNNPDLLYAGIALYHPSILDDANVEKFSIVPRLKKAIQENRVAGKRMIGEWDDVGTPERLSALREKHGE
jgi:MurNAc alpha-1-phosphate uridylyltransferase